MGHLVALEQQYLVKTHILSKPGSRIEITGPLPQPTWCNLTEFLQFSTHPKVPRVCGKLQKLNKIAPGGLWKRARFGVFFSEFLISFFKKLQKLQKNNLSHEKIKKLLPGTYILIYVLWNQ